ncbi:MAG: cytochrome c3 family protein, partial [Planctomycetota bacterium]
NTFTLMVFAGAAGGGAYAAGLLGYFTWPEVMNVGYAPTQPVPFSHRLHAGELKMDCRYCHNTVDKTAHAAVPSTNVCTNCHGAEYDDGSTLHTAIHTKSIKLLGVRESQVSGKPIEWEKIHDLADYVYFNHAIHVNQGVSCAVCHGRIDTMDVVHQAKALTMSWCIECHRNPEPRMRPREEVTNLAWTMEDDPEVHAEKMRDLYGDGESPIRASTNCSTCHR